MQEIGGNVGFARRTQLERATLISRRARDRLGVYSRVDDVRPSLLSGPPRFSFSSDPTLNSIVDLIQGRVFLEFLELLRSVFLLPPISFLSAMSRPIPIVRPDYFFVFVSPFMTRNCIISIDSILFRDIVEIFSEIFFFFFRILCLMAFEYKYSKFISYTQIFIIRIFELGKFFCIDSCTFFFYSFHFYILY